MELLRNKQTSNKASQLTDSTTPIASYLNTKTTKKMIQRFLIEKKMPKEELVEILGITTENLEQLFSQEAAPELLSKINLPIISLYCKTKWV